MTRPKTDDGTRYFIVERSELSTYGTEYGSAKHEAEQLLADAPNEDLVVIKGVLIRPKFVLED